MEKLKAIVLGFFCDFFMNLKPHPKNNIDEFCLNSLVMSTISSVILIIFSIMIQQKHTNHLIKETSPYLLQHAHNPVNWYPWGEETLKKAQAENKLILISIGYSACHWCHVMEHESFENEEIAQLMNEYYVCIKVDREERPDVDQVYMNAVHLMQGQGGWPLNCFALANGNPVYGGTYFPPQKWMQILKSLHLSYKENPQKFQQYAESLLNGIKTSDVIDVKNNNPLAEEKKVHEIFKNISQSFDMQEGGFGKAPKFPFPIGLEFCLAYGDEYDNKIALDFLSLTLNKMAKGGIYDQIGGGFSRYSVDDIWKVPHFEKMLYDNAQLISLYAKAYKINNNPLYKKTIEHSLEFIKRDMTQSEGGFYSALDADSEGIEGKYYVWTKEELNTILKDKSPLYCDYYGVEQQGNWEDGLNILMSTNQHAHWAKKYHLSEADLENIIIDLNRQLLSERQKRIKPGLDDKIITAWNALMLKGYIDAFSSIVHPQYLEIAENNADFLWFKLSDTKGKLFRTYKNGEAKIDGFLDDYAHTIDALLSLYQITFNKKHLDRTSILLEYCQENFLHSKSGMYYYTPQTSQLLIARKMEVSDNVIPASNSIMAHNLMTMGMIKSNVSLVEQAQAMLQNTQDNLLKGQIYYANWDLLLMRFLLPKKEVVIMGADINNLNYKIQKQLSFNTVFVGSTKEAYLPLMENRYQAGKTFIYVCKDQICQLPVESSEKAKGILSK